MFKYFYVLIIPKTKAEWTKEFGYLILNIHKFADSSNCTVKTLPSYRKHFGLCAIEYLFFIVQEFCGCCKMIKNVSKILKLFVNELPKSSSKHDLHQNKHGFLNIPSTSYTRSIQYL